MLSASNRAGLKPVDATPDIISTFAARPLRAVDAMEWQLATGESLSGTLILEKTRNTPVRAMLDEAGHPLCLWGAVPDGEMPDVGLFWLVTAEGIEQHAPATHSIWHHELADMHHTFGAVVALAHTRNHLHHEWLAAIGFKRAATLHIGPVDAEFAAFVHLSEEGANVPAA